ncbi:FAD-dependent oxidoreductase [Bifidobacterium sp. ESL0800]|uniref:FAD-dependent oxidoreductase n=1 Tax=Bifidobacterium sp. ESL0800 TaxID=2983236 RepID=UPI0023F7C47A|nr:FAD-dependent oxidoreductase [Bifidobacterium sp. ESL0800]WEV75378.1 FAD-dependent oxidoreductase [Bifidobacterium sp. ESL0800]
MKQQDDLYDVVVIGGGPAGLTAGLYLARARYRVMILEKEDFGGQINITNEVVNYPGIARTDGRALTETMRQQAEDFGAEFMVADATGLDVAGDIKTVHTNRGDLKTFGILVATGANPRKIGFEGEAEYAGRGVSYCATCDGEFFNGQEVIVVGGGFSAAEESVFLTKYASKVTILARGDDFTCDASVSNEAKNDPNIEIHYNTELKSVSAGEGGLVSAVFHDRKTGEDNEWKPTKSKNFGVFVFAGYVPQTEILKGVVDLDEYGYVITHGYLETTAAGVYAAGDLREKNLRQVVTAVSDGAVAGVELERYAKDLSEKTGLVPPRPTSSNYEKREAEEARKAANSGTSPAPVSSSSSAASSDAGAAAQGGRAKTSGFFDDAIRKQLDVVFGRMSQPLVLQLSLDKTRLSQELKGFIDELVGLSGGKLSAVVAPDSADTEDEEDAEGRAKFDAAAMMPMARPCVRLCKVGADGGVEPTGLAFHGVPSGHEFNSFVLALYNAAGPGQKVDDGTQRRIEALGADGDTTDVMVLVSLTCTMCPTTVLSSQRIAADNPKVRAEAYDISHFPELQKQYGAMSVPCIVVNKTAADGTTTQKVEFGKKSVPQMLDLINEA